MLTLLEVYKNSPKSERTLIKHGYVGWKGTKFINDTAYGPCFYRVVSGGQDLGAIKYYKGRILRAYESCQTWGQISRWQVRQNQKGG